MSDEKSQRNSIPADLQPYYDEPQNGTRAWARWLTRVLAAIIVVVLIAVFARWLWGQTHKDTDTKKSNDETSQTEKAGSSDSANDSNDSTASKPDSSSSASTPSSTTPTTTAAPTSTNGGSAAAATQTVGQSAQNTTLANTGPGQTLVIFAAATLCFAALYQLRLRQLATKA